MPAHSHPQAPGTSELIRHGLVLLLLSLALGVSLRPWWIWLVAPREQVAIGPTQIVGLVGACLALVAYYLHLRWWWQGLWQERSVATLRLLGYGLVLHWATYLGYFRAYESRTLWATWTAGACVFAVLLALRRILCQRLPSRLFRALDLALFYACILLVGGELALRTIAGLHPSVLLSRSDQGAEHRIETLRQPAGTIRFGFQLDSRGFYDEELDDTADQTLVVTLGDSFSQGVVPHYYHYTTVAERLLPGVEIYNAGLAGIDPREYLHLLRTEILPLKPDLVVIGVFIGNDLTFELQPSEPLLSSWYDRRNVLLVQVPRRLRTLRDAAAPALPRAGSMLHAEAEAGVVEQTPDSLALAFPWVADPLAERPTFGADWYREFNLELAREQTRQTPAEYRRRFEVLLEIAEACGDVPLLFLVIPDELQVDDLLWKQTAARSDVPLARHRAQELLEDWLQEQGLPYVDPLSDLRSQAPLADGRVHLYHLRDTHLNARGNRVIGEVLARALRPLVGS